MKVLLLGEFSGLHKNLKEGLEEHGVEVTLAASGDGWKKIGCDISLGSEKSGIVGKIEKIKNILFAIPKLKGFDVVQLISPIIFPKTLGLNRLLIRYIISRNNKVFLVGAGATSANSIIADFTEKEFKYPQLFENIKKSSPEIWSQGTAGRRYNRWLIRQVNGYIPIMYEYAEGFRRHDSSKLCETIPIPINIDKVKPFENRAYGKIVIFHGLNREGVKGTPLIREAMENIQKRYPDEVECVIKGKMALDDYLKYLESVNVVIDQAYSVSAGVNALYNMSMGKVVLGGGDQEFLDEMGVDESPLIPIYPSVKDIEYKLERIIKDKHFLAEHGRRSRKFVEDHHDYRNIAKKYLSAWERY